jgi:hypothetical protein
MRFLCSPVPFLFPSPPLTVIPSPSLCLLCCGCFAAGIKSCGCFAALLLAGVLACCEGFCFFFAAGTLACGQAAARGAPHHSPLPSGAGKATRASLCVSRAMLYSTTGSSRCGRKRLFAMARIRILAVARKEGFSLACSVLCVCRQACRGVTERVGRDGSWQQGWRAGPVGFTRPAPQAPGMEGVWVRMRSPKQLRDG